MDVVSHPELLLEEIQAAIAWTSLGSAHPTKSGIGADSEAGAGAGSVRDWRQDRETA